MNKRAVKFILALSAMTVLDWAVVEFFLIGEFINSYAVSIVWGIFCLVCSCGYSLWKCPWEHSGMRQNVNSKEDESCP